MHPDGTPVPSWASQFDTWLKNALLEGRYEDVNHYDSRAPYGKKAHPWPDHFYPLHVAMGAAGENAKAELLHHSWGNGPRLAMGHACECPSQSAPGT
ncbi:hypothetical protein D5086_008835 [Populus alba]|uniref:Uncharacterized protein n=1 Tax=Populus alba TaxID=43335 RepID=A0ACC4CJ02_POPAL